MSRCNVVPIRQLVRAGWSPQACAFTAPVRWTSTSSATIRGRPKIDGRNRLSAFWAPTSIVNKSDASNQDMLVKGAIMRQAHTGIFHLLPLGLRVQDKIEKLIDKHMVKLGASKVSLSSITSDKLWQQSGRGRNDEFFHLNDRKGAKYLLSPTHEEEITALIAAEVSSYKELPLRLYQVTRKYRDEARPRQGLLRAREFLMKDLYTFDATEQEAKQTYDEVRQAYAAFFAELGVPVIEAGASSGNMGGNLSHEYHFMAKSGEDTVITCSDCGFASNEEVFRPDIEHVKAAEHGQAVAETYGVSKDRSQLYKILTPGDQTDVNMHLVKKLIPDLDTGVEDALGLWNKTHTIEKPDAAFVLVDARLAEASSGAGTIDNQGLTLTRPQKHDPCPSCHQPTLRVGQAIELGHTFHLGTRYSEPFNAVVHDSSGKQQIPIQMGCHGIGMSRIMAAVSSSLADSKGLNWPLSIAPFSALVTATPAAEAGAVECVHDLLQREASSNSHHFDAVIDDRQKSLGYKLNDADVVGYPFIVVLGRKFTSEGKVEVQCRRLGVKEDVVLADLVGFIKSCTDRLNAM